MIADSAAKRDAASRLLDTSRGQFRDIHERNERMLTDLNRDIGHLENDVPKINRHVRIVLLLCLTQIEFNSYFTICTMLSKG